MLRRHIVGFILLGLPGCFKHNKLFPKAKWEELGKGKNGLQWMTRRTGVWGGVGPRMVGDGLQMQHPKLCSAVPWMSPSNLLFKFAIKFAVRLQQGEQLSVCALFWHCVLSVAQGGYQHLSGSCGSRKHLCSLTNFKVTLSSVSRWWWWWMMSLQTVLAHALSSSARNWHP